MDDRIRRHAEVIVDHSTDVSKGDMVRVAAPPVAEDLVVALYEELGKRGARPTLSWNSARAGRAYAKQMDPEDYVTAEHSLAAMEETDVSISIGGSLNDQETGDVPGEISQAAQHAHQPIQEVRETIRWTYTQFPAPGNAQRAEMSTDAYADFVYDAVNLDWEAQREFQAQLVDLLEDASEVRIAAGDSTDVTMNVDGMLAVNDDGKKNLPGGEVFTAPHPESVEGTVTFDKPVIWLGREIRGARLTFEDGVVTDYAAEQHEEALGDVLDTDEGARRLGELGIGMNRSIDRFTSNMLFDEKMGDTVHLAVGKAIDESVPEGVEANESVTHLDMLVDMSEDSVIEFDGEVVQRDGTFVFEDGFEG